MNEPLSTALIVLAVGMITVFVILSLVVFSGNIIIKIVNKYFPETSINPSSVSKTPIINTDLGSSKMAAIVAAVDVITKGKGKINKIEKS